MIQCALERETMISRLCRGLHRGQRYYGCTASVGEIRQLFSLGPQPFHIWSKGGKGAIKWTRLSCRTFAANTVQESSGESRFRSLEAGLLVTRLTTEAGFGKATVQGFSGTQPPGALRAENGRKGRPLGNPEAAEFMI